MARISRELLEIIIRDIDRALAALEPLMQRDTQTWSSDDLKNYVIYTHGMKSSMANVGDEKVSNMAKELEQSGLNNDFATIVKKTPAFIQELHAIKALGAEESTKSAPAGNREIQQSNVASLCEACHSYNKKAAKAALATLGEYSWPKEFEALLAKVDVLLLHGEFEMVVDMLE